MTSGKVKIYIECKDKYNKKPINSMSINATTSSLVVLLSALIVLAIIAILYYTTGQESSSLWAYSKGGLLALFGVG